MSNRSVKPISAIISISIFIWVFVLCFSVAAANAAAVGAVAATNAAAAAAPAPAPGEPLAVHYFYLNVCASCDEREEFLQNFETLTGISRSAPNLEIRTYNVYNTDDNQKFLQITAALGLDAETLTLPLLLVGDRLVDSQEINAYLSKDEFLDTLPNPEFTIPPGASGVIYFYAPGCSDCERAERILGELPDTIADAAGESPVHVMKVSVGDSWGLSLFRTYCDMYEIGQERQKVPAVFVGYSAFMSVSEIEGAEAVVLAGGGRNTPYLKADAAVAAGQGGIPGGFGALGALGALLTGFVNGLNPCSISMLLMLLSLLAAKSKWLVTVGATFLLGKFAGFMLLGTVLYSSLSSLHLTGLRTALNVILVAFAAVMILLNANDILAAKRSDYKNIRLQLPKGLRKLNHEIIKKTAAIESPAVLAAAGAALGFIVSTGEFLCTGQIYLAMIVSTINAGTSMSGAALMLLTLYSLAFVAPPAILIAIVGRGGKIFGVSEFFRKNLMWIKLVNIIVFTAVIVFVFI